MKYLNSIRYFLPIVKLTPIRTLNKRWQEKLRVLQHSYGFSGAHIEEYSGGNAILEFNSDSHIAAKGEKVMLPVDNMIFKHVKIFGEWGTLESDFLAGEINKLTSIGVSPEKITFLDLGANVGLISVQTLRKSSIRVHVIAVEPIPFLVSGIEYNMNSLIPNAEITIVTAALSDETQSANIAISRGNFGGASLTYDASSNLGLDYLTVAVLDSLEFAESHLRDAHHLVIKTDLETYDCKVLSRFPSWVWEKIHAGAVEVTASNDSDLSGLPQLVDYLRRFTRLSWDSHFHTFIDVEEVRSFWSSGTSEIRNLYFTK
jgi:FkbM family methyltransferase